MPTLYLIFGHLIADFMLQPEQLVRWKYKSWKGVVAHSLVHFVVYLLVFLPYLPNQKVFLVILAVGVTHFIIDLMKIKAEARRPHYLYFFFIDQFCHLVVIAFSGMLLADRSPVFAGKGLLQTYYENIYIVLGLSLMILLSYTVEIVKFQLARKKTSSLTFKPDYWSMVRRVLIFVLLYAALMFLGVYRTAAFGL